MLWRFAHDTLEDTAIGMLHRPTWERNAGGGFVVLD
jgi:hypothetical protein